MNRIARRRPQPMNDDEQDATQFLLALTILVVGILAGLSTMIYHLLP